MTNGPVNQKFDSAEKLKASILRVLEGRAVKASESQYDVKVCMSAVAAARQVFENVSVEGTAQDYGRKVVADLSALQADYYDVDGDYTSGKGVIGDIMLDILWLMDESIRGQD